MGGSSNRAQREAQQAEAERQAAIAATTSRVNSIYGSPQRESDIQDFVGATRELLNRELTDQKSETDRQLKFALARGGQIGGSTQIDQARKLGKDYAKGVLEVERRAQGAGADLRAQDQSAKMNLIAMAQGGLDATTAQQQAIAGMRNSLEAARSTDYAKQFGDIFGRFGDFFQQSKEQAQRRKADADFNTMYQSLFAQPSFAGAFKPPGG